MTAPSPGSLHQRPHKGHLRCLFERDSSPVPDLDSDRFELHEGLTLGGEIDFPQEGTRWRLVEVETGPGGEAPRLIFESAPDDFAIASQPTRPKASLGLEGSPTPSLLSPALLLMASRRCKGARPGASGRMGPVSLDINAASERAGLPLGKRLT